MPRLINISKSISAKRALPFGVVVAGFGVVFVLFSMAAGPLAAFEAESGALTGSAKTIALAGASGGSAVVFGASSTPVPTATSAPTTTPTAWPNATNTGVPAGTQLTTAGVPTCDSANGGIQIRTDNLVLDGKLINCSVLIFSKNVTIKNSLIKGRVGLDPWGGPATATLTISNSEITGETITPLCDQANWGDATKTTGLGGGAGVVASRLNIHHFGKAIMSGGNYNVSGSWMHAFMTGNCDTGGAATHGDGVFVWPSSNNVFVGNVIDTADYVEVGPVKDGPSITAAIFLQGDGHSNDIYRGNKLSGGSYIVYAGSSAASVAQNVDFIDNVFVRAGIGYGAVTSYNPANGNDWINNTWADTGLPVAP